jgi:surfactin synthase thioesterase subunit
MATPEQAADWARFTTATFQLTVINGGHFAAYEHAEVVFRAVAHTMPMARQAAPYSAA